MNKRTIIMKGNKRLSISEQLQNNKDLERLQALRYIDDDFMTVCLEDNFEAVELILRIILNQDDIIIKSIKTQDPLKNLQGRSAVLDVHQTVPVENLILKFKELIKVQVPKEPVITAAC